MKAEWLDATQRGDCERVRELLAAGADINSLDRHGQTALMNAAYRGDLDLARLLVERGADLNRTAKHRLTALMLAVINNRAELVELLFRAGADSQLKGSSGHFAHTPLEYAEKNGNESIASILRSRS